jgi:hypothetical protein
MGTMQLVIAVLGLAAVGGYLWAATKLANYPAPWSAPWQVARLEPLGAAGNAAIRLLALGGIAAVFAWKYSPGQENYHATHFGSNWFPQFTSSNSLSLPDLTWLWITLAVSAFGLIAIGRIRRGRRHRLQNRDASLGADSDKLALKAVVDETLAALMREADPRHAILACYALMERSLAVRGTARNPEETALEYARRLLALAGAPAEPVGSLTGLFHLAAFSSRAVDEGMRQTAISSLHSIREAAT